MRRKPLVRIACGGILLSLVLLERTAKAWLFEEHANITRFAFVNRRNTEIDHAWTLARSRLSNLCQTPSPRQVGPRDPNDRCIDFGMLVALAGDHSCSVAELERDVLDQTWVPRVLVDAATVSEELAATAPDSTARIDLWHRSHLDLQRDDSAYLDRAANNNAHFLVQRRPEDGDVVGYLRRILSPGAEVGATKIYLAFHSAALARAATFHASGEASADDATQAILAEAMALHFLQDSFSAGHIVGTHGDAAERKGTHDRYCQYGYEFTTWGGDSPQGIHGDAFLTPSDMSVTAQTVARSLDDLLGALRSGSAGADSSPFGAAVPLASQKGEALDACLSNPIPKGLESPLTALAQSAALLQIVNRTPRPPSAQFDPPQFSSEVGMFLRGSFGGALEGTLAGYAPFGFLPSGAIDTPPYSARQQAMMQAGLGIGFAANGLTTSTRDLEIYVQGNVLVHSSEQDQQGRIAIIDPRSAFGAQIRLPFWAIPGDLVPLQLLWLFDRRAAFDVLMTASAGGVLHVERVVPLGDGLSLQFVLGRELGIYRAPFGTRAAALYDTRVVSLPTGPAPPTTYQSVVSTEYDIPFFELRSHGLYFGDLGSGLAAKLGLFFDDYQDQKASNDPHVGWAWGVLLKLEFEGRYYVWRP